MIHPLINIQFPGNLFYHIQYYGVILLHMFIHITMLILWEWYIYYEGKSFFFSRKYNFKYCVIDTGFHFCWWFKLRFSFIWNFQKFDRNFNEWNDNAPWKNPSCTAMTLPTLSSCIMSSWFTLFLFILDVHNLSLLFFFLFFADRGMYIYRPLYRTSTL